MRHRKLTDAERAERRQADRERLEQAARALLTSDGWQRWARTRASFHDYSAGNCMLIALQRPDATRVAGFRRWQELGRQVRKGEHGIRIMAPMVLKDRDSAEEDATRVVFRAVSVFDIGQTDGEPLPEAPCEPISGDSHSEYVGKLEAFARSLGIEVLQRPLEHAAGYYSAKDKQIVVSSSANQAPNATVHVLVHELAHAVGVPTYKEHGRDNAEVIVETAATIVCGALGLDTSGESVPYIAGWGEANDVEAIRRYAETVDEIARTLEGALGIAAVRS